MKVTVAVCIAARGQGKRPMVFCAWRIKWPPQQVRRRCKAHFGIETSYRQLGEGLAVTTSKDERVRLLLVGLALVLRQCWCLEMDQANLTGQGRKAVLRLVELRTWLVIQLALHLGLRLELLTYTPDGPILTAA